MIAAYWDVLTAHAFGNFRQLLEALTLNAAMGSFLNTRGNLKENSRGRQPDENFAREVMQLFTIGLYELNPDGTHKLDANSKPDGNLRPGRRHQSRARVHRLQLGLSIQWRHVHARLVGTKSGTEHASRHQPHAFQLEQSFQGRR